MAEIPGLRPLKETNTIGDSPTHYAILNGAYDIYVQADYLKGSDGQYYYAAKWLRLQAGTYLLKHITDDYGIFRLEGTTVAEGTSGGTFKDYLRTEFTVAANGVYRWDVIYQNHVGGVDPSYTVYELSRDGVIIEVSRANDFVGDVVPIPDAALGTRPPYNNDVRLSYPVFLAKPDWKSGIIERLEWNTDVLSSETGAEQRRKLRQVPRRSLEGQFNAFGNNRALIDSYVTGVGANYGLLPLWYDESMVESLSVAGSIDIFGDFNYRDYNVNDVVLIRRNDTFDYELNVVQEKRAGQLVLAYGLSADTPRGATITPVRVAQLRDQITGTLLTDEVQQYSIRFYTLENYEMPPAWNLPSYTRTNLPILTLEPDYRESISLTFDRTLYTQDNTISYVLVRDPGGQVSTGQKFSYHFHGRAALYSFKQMLFKMSGRWREFHIPTGHNDIALTRDVDSSQGALIGYRNGYSQYVKTEQLVRRDILIQLWNGQNYPNTIISSRVVGDEEWFFLSETTPAFTKASVKRVSYMPRGRLDVDAVEVMRLTDADGASTVSLTFKSLDERRVAPPITF